MSVVYGTVMTFDELLCCKPYSPQRERVPLELRTSVDSIF